MATINETSVKAHIARVRESDGKSVDAFLWDDKLTGFGCKATPAGKRAFFVQYRPRGTGQNIKRVHIGYYGAITVAQARTRAEKLLGATKAGDDPREAEKAKLEAAKAAKAAAKAKAAMGTLQTVIERYLAGHAKGTRYWHEKRQRLLGSDLKPLHGVSIRDVTRAQLKGVLDSVKARSHAAARLLFADLRPLFKWAVEIELIGASPMTGIKGPAPIKARERVLDPHEVAALWHATAAISWPFQSIYRLLLLTGARREEAAGMRWSELDLDTGTWTLPGARTKNGREHRLPLVPSAVALLDRVAVEETKRRLRFPLDSDLVFSTTGTTAPSGWSKAKKALDRAMQGVLGSRFKPWRVHDLRRTAATGMEDLGIPTHIVETALNHVSGAKAGIVGVYQRAEHREAVKRAFLAWEKRLLEIVSGGSTPSNIVPLRKSA